MVENPQKVIVGKAGASGLGWSELKDIECYRRYAYIQADKAAAGPRTTLIPITPENEHFPQGSFLHAARAKWFELGFGVDKPTLEQCYAAGKEECVSEGYDIYELKVIEYSLQFLNYANYWAIRPKIKPYALEYYMEFTFDHLASFIDSNTSYLKRSTRLDGISWHPDVGGYCIDEFKTTFDMGGTVKYYDSFNPQLLLQKLIYDKCRATGFGGALEDGTSAILPPIKGAMIDVWDKGKLKGTRSFVLFNDKVVANFERWLINTLTVRKVLFEDTGQLPLMHRRNMMVCNTFNDAFKNQCRYKGRCAEDEE